MLTELLLTCARKEMSIKDDRVVKDRGEMASFPLKWKAVAAAGCKAKDMENYKKKNLKTSLVFSC